MTYHPAYAKVPEYNAKRKSTGDDVEPSKPFCRSSVLPAITMSSSVKLVTQYIWWLQNDYRYKHWNLGENIRLHRLLDTITLHGRLDVARNAYSWQINTLFFAVKKSKFTIFKHPSANRVIHSKYSSCMEWSNKFFSWSWFIILWIFDHFTLFVHCKGHERVFSLW